MMRLMSRMPFDPMKTAAMRKAKPAQGQEPLPLAPHEERALIEAHASGAPPLSASAAGSAQKPLSVSQTNGLVAHAMNVALPAQFFVQGEISNFKTYNRGHAFFTLKDAQAELPCMMWSTDLQRLKFKPRDGMAVIARGAIRLYEQQGKVQLYVDTLLPQGAGSLELAFRQLCDKLRNEGLFEQTRKRPIPKFPRHVALVTSRTGDVLHDVLTTAWRRYAGLRVSLFPVRVQGEQAAGDIIRALQLLSAHPSAIDLILLVRGGGSLEDLWAFNEESLARAIIASRIPIATGIGHEPDTTIADLVGDLRGPTPTGITELTIPDARALCGEIASHAALLTRDIRRAVTFWHTRLDRATLTLRAVTADALRTRRHALEQHARKVAAIEPRHAIAQGWRRSDEAQRRLQQATRLRLMRKRDQLTAFDHRLQRNAPQIGLPRLRDRLAHLESRLAVALHSRVAARLQKLAAVEAQLRAVSPQAVLDRGYSITSDKEGNIIRSAAQVQRGDVLTTRVAEGEIQSTVGKPKQGQLF